MGMIPLCNRMLKYNILWDWSIPNESAKYKQTQKVRLIRMYVYI
jgi:hypothetical protein